MLETSSTHPLACNESSCGSNAVFLNELIRTSSGIYICVHTYSALKFSACLKAAWLCGNAKVICVYVSKRVLVLQLVICVDVEISWSQHWAHGSLLFWTLDLLCLPSISTKNCKLKTSDFNNVDYLVVLDRSGYLQEKCPVIHCVVRSCEKSDAKTAQFFCLASNPSTMYCARLSTWLQRDRLGLLRGVLQQFEVDGIGLCVHILYMIHYEDIGW